VPNHEAQNREAQNREAQNHETLAVSAIRKVVREKRRAATERLAVIAMQDATGTPAATAMQVATQVLAGAKSVGRVARRLARKFVVLSPDEMLSPDVVIDPREKALRMV
jgi:RNase P protein component